MPVTIGTLILLIAAGSALVAQNVLMARIAVDERILAALLVNAAVGLSLIVVIAFVYYGHGFLADTAGRFRPWWVAPGLLGTLFVLASATGYSRLGAATTVTTLVAAQLLTALLVDAFGIGVPLRQVGPSQWLGAAPLVVGAALVLRTEVR